MGCLSSWENRTKPATGEPKNGASVEDLGEEVKGDDLRDSLSQLQSAILF